MQAHVRHVEKFTNFMSPVGLSISHYNGSNPRSKHGRQRFQHLTNPPNVTGNVSGSGSDSEHGAPQNNSNQHSQQIQHSTTLTVSNVNRITKSTQRRPNIVNLEDDDNDDIKVQTRMNDSQWARENLSLRHTRNRQMYFEADSNSSHQSKDVMNQVLDRLVIYGYETSADIAKMQPWQLRVLKKEIPQIDFIFMTAYRMWGKQEYYDDHQNLAFRQYWDSAVWLQYNEIELIIKCFDAPRRGYQCMICRTTHGLYELDQVRWHIWLEHKNAPQLNAIMQASKRHNDYNFAKPLENLQLPSLERGGRGPSPSQREKSQSQTEVISLLDDSTDDEMESKKQRRSSSTQKRGRYSSKGRQYNSRRSGGPDNDQPTPNNNNTQRRRRSRRLQNKNGNHNDNETIQQPNPIQNPIIINGVDDDLPQNYQQDDIMEIHGSQSPAFMPSANYNQQPSHNNNGSSTILDTMNTMKNNSNYSLDTHDTVISNEMEMDDGNDYYDNNDIDNDHNHNHNHNHNQINDNTNNQSPDMQMEEFTMVGFNDDFTTLGVMGALSRNSSDSFNGLNLNSAFTDNNFVQLNLH